jgi:hypothetical protein
VWEFGGWKGQHFNLNRVGAHSPPTYLACRITLQNALGILGDGLSIHSSRPDFRRAVGGVIHAFKYTVTLQWDVESSALSKCDTSNLSIIYFVFALVRHYPRLNGCQVVVVLRLVSTPACAVGEMLNRG